MATTQPLKGTNLINDAELEELIGMEISNVVESRIASFQGAEMAARTVAQDPDVKGLIAETLRQAVEETGTPQLQDIDNRIRHIYEIKAQRIAMEAATAQNYLVAAQAASAPKVGTSKYPPVTIANVQPGQLITAGTFNQLAQAIRNHDARLRALEGGARGDSITEDVMVRVLNSKIEALEKRLDALVKAPSGTQTPPPPPARTPPRELTPEERRTLEKEFKEELLDQNKFRDQVLEKNQKIEIRKLPKDQKSIFEKGNIDPNPDDVTAEIKILKGNTETEIFVEIPKNPDINIDSAKEVVFGGVLFKGDEVIRETNADGSLTLKIDTAAGKGTPLKETEVLKTGGFEIRNGGNSFGAPDPIIGGFGRFGPT